MGVIRIHLRQLIGFGIAGGFATLIDLSVFNLVIALSSVDPRFASFVSAPFGLLTVFLMNKYVAFRGREGKTATQVLRFALVYGVAALLNISLTAIFITVGPHVVALPMVGLANASKLLAVLCVALWNYVLLHSFVFARRASL